MLSRGKRMLSMLSHKDIVRVGQLEFPQTKYETTKGANLKDIDIDKLKLAFNISDDIPIVDSQTDICNGNENSDVNLLIANPVQKQIISDSVNIISCVVVPCRDLQSAVVDDTKQHTNDGRSFSNETCAGLQTASVSMDNQKEPRKTRNFVETGNVRGVKSNIEINDELFPTTSGSLIAHEGVTFTELTNVFNSATDDCNSSPERHSFSDSGTSYVPDSDSMPETDLGLSSESEESTDSAAGNKYKMRKCPKKAKSTSENLQKTDTQQGRKTKLGKFNEMGQVKSSSRTLKGQLKRDKKEHCVYCEKNVTNFSRHLIRNHENEFEVVKLKSLPKSSKERKCLFDDIRKRGNFINSFGPEGCINPVRRPQSACQKKSSDYLPCSGCKGFFTRTYLHRHIKKCSKITEGSDSKHAQANGLVLLHMTGEDNFDDLKSKVFPHMQSDDVTKTVINDSIIKYYGQRYYRCHKEKHLINTVSQRMRELARFLIILQRGKLKLFQLVDYLKPCYFDQLVDATNELSGYDSNCDTFKSPSLALRWATVLKQVCDIAMFIATKEGDKIKNKDLKTLKQMIETQFRYYVSTNANKDLTSKNWKKGSMLPLTEDVIRMNEFVVIEEGRWAEALEGDTSNSVYVRNLTEVLQAHVILLNRKRSGEVQRITIKDYLRKEDNSVVQDIYHSLTATEKTLIKNIKRCIIRGKKRRAVPVIFTKAMQVHVEILLKSRKFVASSNPYLFANPTTEDGFLWSYKVLKKIAFACNVKNIEVITATCLRKHIATIAQIISMDDNDLEQLSSHLGHEKATHLNYYRKTDDHLQIAKVSKFLLLMENNSISQYRGKSLEDIDLEIPDLNNVEDATLHKKDSSTIEKLQDLNTENNTEDYQDIQPPVECETISKKRRCETPNSIIQLSGKEPNTNGRSQVDKRRILIPWTNEQKKLAQTFFRKNLLTKKPPRKHECERLQELYPTTFKNKTWPQIKIFTINQYNKI